MSLKTNVPNLSDDEFEAWVDRIVTSHEMQAIAQSLETFDMFNPHDPKFHDKVTFRHPVSLTRANNALNNQSTK